MSQRPFDYLNPHMEYINEPGSLIRDNGQKPMDGYSGFNGKFGIRRSRKSKKVSRKKSKRSKRSKSRRRKFSKKTSKKSKKSKKVSKKRRFSKNKKSWLGYSQEDFKCPYCNYKMKTIASPDILVKWNVLPG
jgi:hypothetical protein